MARTIIGVQTLIVRREAGEGWRDGGGGHMNSGDCDKESGPSVNTEFGKMRSLLVELKKNDITSYFNEM